MLEDNPLAQSFGPKSFEFSFGFHIVIQILETHNFGWLLEGGVLFL